MKEQSYEMLARKRIEHRKLAQEALSKRHPREWREHLDEAYRLENEIRKVMSK